MRLKIVNCALLRHFKYSDSNISYDRYNSDHLDKDRFYFIVGDMMSKYANLLVKYAHPYIELPYTEELDTTLWDSDTPEETMVVNTENVQLARPDDEMNRGRNIIFLSSNTLKGLTTADERNKYVLDCCYDSLKSYVKHFNHSTEGLDDAYKRILANGFYFNAGICLDKKKLTHKKLNLFAQVRKRSNLEMDEYRFIVKDQNTEEIVFSEELPAEPPTTYMDSQHEDNLEQQLYLANAYLIEDGWKRDKFYFQWEKFIGKPERKYEFDWKTQKLTITNESN